MYATLLHVPGVGVGWGVAVGCGVAVAWGVAVGIGAGVLPGKHPKERMRSVNKSRFIISFLRA